MYVCACVRVRVCACVMLGTGWVCQCLQVILSPVLDFDLGRICDGHLPKYMLFGWLPQIWKCFKPFRTQSHQQSFTLCAGRTWVSFVCHVLHNQNQCMQLQLFCDQCNRYFRRPQNTAKHRCDSIRSRCTSGSSNVFLTCEWLQALIDSICRKTSIIILGGLQSRSRCTYVRGYGEKS